MSNLPAVPAALDLLEQQLRRGGDADHLLVPLRALQFRGLSKIDLVVHVERVRAQNAMRESDEDVEESCTLALEIIEGDLPRHQLIWDDAHAAASLIPRVLSVDDLHRALAASLEPSDLLPPRRTDDVARVLGELAPRTLSSLEGFAFVPTRAAFYAAPKTAFTTRPAALLRTPDRLVLEALVAPHGDAIEAALPAAVLWPRNRTHRLQTSVQDIVLSWESQYVVKADITDFYTNVEHATLATFLVRFGGMPVLSARALDALLGAVMGSVRGLPQGPPVSEFLASAYLLPVDKQLEADSIEYVRYADDFYFPAGSVGESRQILRQLEALIGDIGLTLNSAKTRVMKRDTFVAGQRKPLRDVENLRLLAENPPEREDEVLAALEDAGVDEQTMWELAYRHTLTVEDVVEGIVQEKLELVAEFYANGLSVAAGNLALNDLPPDMSAVETLASEGFAFLSGAPNVALAPETVVVLNRWFPSLAPRVVELLQARSPDAASWTDDVIGASLDDPWDDWATSWICYAAGVTGSVQRSGRVRQLLSTIATSETYGELARSEAVRALMRADSFDPEVWVQVFQAASVPLRAEMLLIGLAEAPNTRWITDRQDLVEHVRAALGSPLSDQPTD